ncbi:hypothetical protein H681_03940 [Pseudomonas sp. ATCC 13867]|uniref:DUF4123 domain-containing protein n=1 Tax=Pseudomonas sp. ATCC 13867 TaxID=1294143 RepID=UPI0002C4ED43|nr:DUF4123 domain-containing protein [Pseudomonas sp. ATCC 13867]AGI22670.1 hypothetical protein H681_03940 [Pseudomonas sp. ATCC 13867]
MSDKHFSGALLLDGAAFDDVTRWTYDHYSDVTPLLLFRGTDYAPIAEAGPVLIGTSPGSPIHRHWQSGSNGLSDAVWLESTTPTQVLFASLQRRSRVLAPDGREFWLRLGIAGPLRNAWKAGLQWPDGFWYGVSRVWLHHEGITHCAWDNPIPRFDCTRPTTNPLEAQLVLDWPLLQALSVTDPQEVD